MVEDNQKFTEKMSASVDLPAFGVHQLDCHLRGAADVPLRLRSGTVGSLLHIVMTYVVSLQKQYEQPVSGLMRAHWKPEV